MKKLRIVNKIRKGKHGILSTQGTLLNDLIKIDTNKFIQEFKPNIEEFINKFTPKDACTIVGIYGLYKIGTYVVTNLKYHNSEDIIKTYDNNGNVVKTTAKRNKDIGFNVA